MTDAGFDEEQFRAHVELLQSFVARRDTIVDCIQGVLNAARRPIEYLQDRSLLSRLLEDCYFHAAALTDVQARLRGQLERAHWASGFTPRRASGLHNDLIHPAEMAIRGFYCWHQTRWPGRNGRIRYAQTLFNVYIVRCLELLSMRSWDAGATQAGGRLARIQEVLDALWRSSPADQPVLVRDARWLIPLAQSPTTDELAAYFEVAEQVATIAPERDRMEIQKAAVVMIGGHLRSQIRHYCLQDRLSIDDKSVVLRTRTSNALDFALLIQALVPLLETFERACQSGDDARRAELASTIFQGISPDPDVFLNRLDLLGPYSMIEHLFVATDRLGRVDYTPMGRRHMKLLREYEALIGRVAVLLHDDCPRFKPIDGAYSPHGAIYGTPSNLTEHMALKAIQRDAVTRFTLEDVFTESREGTDKLAWVNGWRRLPHIDAAVQQLHEYPQQFAEDMFGRIERALRDRVGRSEDDSETADAAQCGKFRLLPGEALHTELTSPSEQDSSSGFLRSSDAQIVAAQAAIACEQTQLLRDRQEGHFLVSYETPNGWVAVSKDVLTEVLGTGADVRITGLPDEAAGVLRAMCPDCVDAESLDAQASAPPSILNA